MEYQAKIHLGDVIESTVVELPQRLLEAGQLVDQKDIILQITLCGVGNKNQFVDKYKKKLQKMKIENQPIAKVNFKYKTQDREKNQISKLNDLSDQINLLIQKNRSNLQKQNDIQLTTSLPYFDLIKNPETDQQKLIKQTDQNNGYISYIPKLLSKSDTMTQDQFTQIVSSMPSYYKIGEWSLLFSSKKHGSSLQTLLKNVEGIQPLIISIQDVDNYIFGCYLSDSLKMVKTFYGSGECFLFTFKDQKIIEVYKWASLNSDIILCDSDGIAIGCGDKYGLYINDDLDEGYTAFCSTFLNEQLSKQASYTVNNIEIWGLIAY